MRQRANKNSVKLNNYISSETACNSPCRTHQYQILTYTVPVQRNWHTPSSTIHRPCHSLRSSNRYLQLSFRTCSGPQDPHSQQYDNTAGNPHMAGRICKRIAKRGLKDRVTFQLPSTLTNRPNCQQKPFSREAWALPNDEQRHKRTYVCLLSNWCGQDSQPPTSLYPGSFTNHAQNCEPSFSFDVASCGHENQLQHFS